MSLTIRPLVSEAGKSLKVTEEWEQKIRTGKNETFFERCFFGEKLLVEKCIWYIGSLIS